MSTVRDLELTRLRQLTPAEKLAVSQAMWREAWALRRASIAAQHPEWSKEQVERVTRAAVSGERA